VQHRSRVIVGLAATLAGVVVTGALAAQQRTPGSTPPHGPLQPFSMTMEAVFHPDDEFAPTPPTLLLGDKIEMATWQGKPAIRRESTVYAPDRSRIIRWEITYSDPQTFRPLSSEWRRGDGLFIRRTFQGQHVTEQRTSLDVMRAPRTPPGTPFDTLTSEFTLAEPVYDWLGGAGLPVLLGLPLRAGLEGSLPVMSASSDSVAPCTVGPCVVARLSYQVNGPETVTSMSGGSTTAWRVQVAQTGFTFWITTGTPRLAQVSWPGKGGNFSLADATESTGS